MLASKKSCELVGSEYGGISSEIISGMAVASRGEDIANHIGPLYASIRCTGCSTKEVHRALDAVVIHDLHTTDAVARKIATLMQCMQCSSTGVLVCSDYDDDRDYCLQCDDLISLTHGEMSLKEWSGLHRCLGFYVVA